MNVQADDHIKHASTVVRTGGIIIFPTDTAFGIGCRIDSKEAVDRLFTLRKRPLSQATPVLVDSAGMAALYYDDPPPVVQALMTRYWPGALTIVAPCNMSRVYSPVRGGGNTIGLRMPKNDTILCIIRAVGVPVLGPSANFHGDRTPYAYSELNESLTRLVDYVVPGVCTLKGASTVVDCSVKPVRIVRQGAVTLSDSA